MKKRFLPLLMAVCLVITLMPVTALAADEWTADTSWYSADETSYTIDSAAELAGLAQLVNGGNNFSGKTITLASNIDLAGQEWTPIGQFLGGKSTSYFGGTFDGDGYTISGLTIKQAADAEDAYTYYGYGLFGAAGAGAAFRDLIIAAPAIQLDQAKNVGALLGGVGYAGASAPVVISNIQVTNAVISANGRVGGIVG